MSIHHTDQLDWAPKKNNDIQSLQKFQKNIASSLLQYTEDKDETRTNSKLVSALLFMLHISSEIVKSVRMPNAMRWAITLRILLNGFS